MVVVGEMDCHCLTSRNSAPVVATKASLAFRACFLFPRVNKAFLFTKVFILFF
jgi:hypothetical protein